MAKDKDRLSYLIFILSATTKGSIDPKLAGST